MAFLCPVRIRRNKKKKPTPTISGYASDGDEKISRSSGLGRITGSASIETLVRVGLEKEQGLSPDSKMVVIQDFTPCVDDELEVRRGEVINTLYQENDWVYVIAEAGKREGFIPQTYVVPAGSAPSSLLLLNQKMKKMPRALNDVVPSPIDTDHNTTLGTSSGGPRRCDSLYDFDNPTLINSDSESYNNSNSKINGNKTSDSSLQSVNQSPDVHPFFKDPAGHYIVLYTFIARDENDVSVERGEFVTVLNREDPDWYWVVRSDGQEGFVPSGFVYPADVIQEHIQQGASTTETTNLTESLPVGNISSPQQTNYGNSPQHHLTSASSDELRFHGSELVMLYDYKAQAPDDLSVRRGDWIYADLSNQTVDGWLWAYAPKTRKCGFIPKAYARPPAMTSL